MHSQRQDAVTGNPPPTGAPIWERHRCFHPAASRAWSAVRPPLRTGERCHSGKSDPSRDYL